MAHVTFARQLFAEAERHLIRRSAGRLPADWRVVVGFPGSASLEIAVGGPEFFTVKGLEDEGAESVASFLESLQPAGV